MKVLLRRFLFIVLLSLTAAQMQAQFLMDLVDTSKTMGKDMLGMYNRLNGFRISGYIQPQFQMTDTAGAKSFEGGDFSLNSDNRFMIRRGRIRLDYLRLNQKHEVASQFVFQFDGTERAFVIRDLWGRVFDNKWQLFHVTAGIFARPFGYETNLGSADRESPERGRMNQILMKTERDLGFMVSLEPRGRRDFLKYIKYDIGVFNGQGLSGTTDYDGRKDIITRLALKPYPITRSFFVSAGASFLQGGVYQNSKYHATLSSPSGVPTYTYDSVGVKGTYAPRQYVGGDIQFKLKHKWGATELRAEVIAGQQTASLSSSETPGSISTDTTNANALVSRRFSGMYFYFLQNIINPKHQLVLKFDVYDPNTEIAGAQIGATKSNFKSTEIRYQTFGVGYNHYFNENLRLLVYYAMVQNEKTALAPFTKDVRDNVLTTRLQFRF